MANKTGSTPVMDTSFTRVWTIPFGAAPDRTPVYHGMAMAGSVDYPLGDITKIEQPSEDRYGEYVEIQDFQASPERVSLPLTFLFPKGRSEVLEYVRRRCSFDTQIHFGTCEDVRDFDFGWAKIWAFIASKPTNYGTSDLGSLQGDERELTTESLDISAPKFIEILRMNFSQVQRTLVSEALIAIDLCDRISCGDCGDPSDGKSKVFAVSDPAASSPGILPQVIATEDGFGAAVESTVSTFALGENPSDAECVGAYYAIVSNDTNSVHYANKEDILDGTAVWAEIATGFVTGGEPNAIASYGPLDTWVVGDGGYVYFTSDITAGMEEVQDDGGSTTEDLISIDALSRKVVIAGGENGAFVYTLDGQTWQLSVTEPENANLTTVAGRTSEEWWVGTATGKVYYTRDNGDHWTEVTSIKGTPTNINKIKWANETVGFILIDSATGGKVLRTVSAGKTWYVMPESGGSALPGNDQLNDIAIPSDDCNIVYIAGVATGGSDGILIKGIDQ